MQTLDDVKRLRKKLGLTQSQLAKKAGVSQALIARIENGTVDPRYSTLQKILSVLEQKNVQKLYAKDLMTSPIYYVLASEKLSKAIRIMREKNVSQLPVLDKSRVVGTVSESLVMEKFSELKDMRRLEAMRVSKIMGPPLPQVGSEEEFDKTRSLLEHFQAVLVGDGAVSGIITKADILKLA